MPAATPKVSDPDLSLAMAVVASAEAPVLLLDADRLVVCASEAFCNAFGIDYATIVGSAFESLGAGEWAIPQLHSLLKATAAGFADVRNYELELKRTGRAARCLVLNAHKLHYGDGQEIRLLVSISDVTDVRLAQKANDDLIRDNGILLKEIQHRVANSLQIIASVLMQSARRVASDEARGYLQDAHHRVMSVAAIQKQLAVVSIDRVSLRPYLSQLCESIGASMIHDPDKISLGVKSDEHQVDAAVAVSLGLIVTELIINALKHAFPGGRRGRITVEYSGTQDGWTLTIADDGVGMSTKPGLAEPGLGTNIVQALAKQLDARIMLSDRKPGTGILLEHSPSSTGKTLGSGAAVTAV